MVPAKKALLPLLLSNQFTVKITLVTTAFPMSIAFYRRHINWGGRHIGLVFFFCLVIPRRICTNNAKSQTFNLKRLQCMQSISHRPSICQIGYRLPFDKQSTVGKIGCGYFCTLTVDISITVTYSMYQKKVCTILRESENASISWVTE